MFFFLCFWLLFSLSPLKENNHKKLEMVHFFVSEETSAGDQINISPTLCGACGKILLEKKGQLLSCILTQNTITKRTSSCVLLNDQIGCWAGVTGFLLLCHNRAGIQQLGFRW